MCRPVQQPIADLDRVDHPSVRAVLDEGCRRCHSDVVERREDFSAVKEDVVEREMEVTCEP